MSNKLLDREYRTFTDFRLEEDTVNNGDVKEYVRGYATTFDTPYVLYEDNEVIIKEVIRKNAFDNTDMADVIMQYNHEGRVFARNKNNTLTLFVDSIGLGMQADLDGTDIGRQLKQEIRGGYTDKMSMGFAGVTDNWVIEETGAKRIETREIIGIRKLYDVSAVSIPANDYTSISVRNLTNGVLERLKAERLLRKQEIRQRKLKRLEIQLMLQGVRK